MLQRVPKITKSELDAATEEARRDFGEQGDERPAGARSIEEWAELVGVGHTTMRSRMRKAIAEGKYESVPAKVRGASGQMYTVSMYRKVRQQDAVDRIRG